MPLIAVDPGMTVTGVVLFRIRESQIIPVQGLAIEPDGETWLEKACHVADQIKRLDTDFRFAIEEPIYSWGRRNPKGFAKQNLFLGALITMLDSSISTAWTVNPKSMKLHFAGNGKADKDLMIKKAEWFLEKRKYHPDEKSTFVWPKRKAHREAIADALGIGVTAWRFHLGQTVTGVEPLIK